MSHGKFKYESHMASDEVAGYLESLAAGIRQRAVRFESGRDSVSLHVADAMSFQCSASENPEKGHTGFALSVEWRAVPHEGAGASPGMHVTPRSMVEEQAMFATEVARRPALILALVDDPDAPSASETSDTAALDTDASRRRTRRTKASTQKRAAAPTRISSSRKTTRPVGRGHAHRRVAS